MGQPSIRRVLCVAVGLYALFTLAAYHLWSAALDSPRSANERRADASAGANGQPRASRGRRGGAKSGARADERRAGAPEWPTNHRVDAFDVDKATADRAGGAPVDVHADVTLVDDARLAGHRKIAPRSGAALTRAAQATLAQVATGQRAGMDSMAGKAAGGAERVDRVRGDTPTQALAGAPRAPDAPSLDAEPPCPGAHPRYRIAIVIAWLGPSPAWFAHFAASAARSSYLVDFLLFHEGELDAPPVTTSARRAPLPRNVISINVGDGGLAAKFGFGMAKALGWQGASTRKLVAAFRVLFKEHPRLLAEYKPAFGAIFEKQLIAYSHWGYADVDQLWGDLPRHVDVAELRDFDVFSWSFGDQAAFYLRGQWTVHAARPELARIWTACAHLGAGLLNEVLAKVHSEARRTALVANRTNGGKGAPGRRFISAEGCYSKAMAAVPGIRLAISTKQLIGDDQRHPHVVAAGGRVWSCAGGKGAFAALDREQLRRAAGALARQPARCEQALQPTLVPRDAAALEPLRVSNRGCGAWIQPEFRMCAAKRPGEDEREWRVTLRNGTFWKERVMAVRESVTVSVGSASDGKDASIVCAEASFFHFQEWKKSWSRALWDAVAPSDGSPPAGLLLSKSSIVAV